MIQQLFSYMHQTLHELQQDFQSSINMDQELGLLEKYLTIKEMIEDISDELSHVKTKLKEFERENGLELPDPVKSANPANLKGEEEEEVVIELDEDDFLDFQKGIGFFDLWMYDHAIVHLEKVMDKYPDFNLARLYTAMTYFQKGDLNTTKQQLKILFHYTEDKDLLSLGHNLLGMTYGKDGLNEQAIEEFQQAIENRKDWDEPQFNLAMIYYRVGHYDDAISVLKNLHIKKPQDWEVAYYLGKSYQKLNQELVANEWFKKAYGMTKHPKMIQQIAINFEKRKQFRQAIYWFEKWHTLEPNRPEPLLSLSKNLWLSGEKTKAKALLKKYFSIHQETLESLLTYAWILTEEGEQEKLQNLLTKLLTINPTDQNSLNPALLASLARLYSVHQKHQQSEDFIQVLMESVDDNVKGLAHMVKGMIHLDQNQPKEALLRFIETSKSGISFPYLDFYLGYTHYLLGNVDDAKQHWINFRKEKNLI